VRRAVEEASHFFVDLFELQATVGAYLAKMSGAEYGMITSCSAGAMAAATAGCIAGTDPKNIYQLPDTTGMKGEAIIMGARSAFDSAIRLTGAKLKVAHTVEDLPTVLNSQTAMIYTDWTER
jgi:seryl-tRNA(Sec) selenium transferase